MIHDPVVWGPNPRGGLYAMGLPLPEGWLMLCRCGSVACGFSSEEITTSFAESHVADDTYVYTWLGDNADDLWTESVRRAGPGRVYSVWGGVAGYRVTVTVGPVGPDTARRRVQLVWGDLVIIYGYRPDAELLVVRLETGETF